jgi:acyl-coenzyme A synthetase/AMP-(fatty) acid ligase
VSQAGFADARAHFAADERIRAATALWREQGWYQRITMGQALTAGLAANPADRLVFCSQAKLTELTLAQLALGGQRVAGALRHLGLRRGDVLVSQLPQWPEGLELWYAATLLGLVYVPVIHIYGPAELAHIVRDSGARAAVLPWAWRGIDYPGRIESLLADERLEHLIVVGSSAPAGCLRWADMIGAALERAVTQPDPAISPADPCLLLYTSGTTSSPKGVVHSSESLVAEFAQSAPVLARAPGSVTLDVSPAGHMASLIGVTRPLLAHNNLTLFMESWDPRLAASLINEYRVTSSGGPPYFLSTLLDLADATADSLSSLQEFALGGSAVPEEVALRAEHRGITTYRLYGSTEQPTISCGHPGDDISRRISTDGRLLPGASVRIVDESGRDVPAGAEGEIVSMGPDLMLGYTDFAASERAFDADGYFLTGDIGTLSADSVLKVTGRKKDIIIRGGENLSALEIEEILLRHPAVREAAAVAVPDPVFVERVAAVVSLKPGVTLDLDDVRKHFTSVGVAKQKTPEQLVVVADLPHSATGKVMKQELRRLLQNQLEAGPR